MDLISRQAALDAIRPLQTYKLFEGDDMILVDKAEVQTELMMLPTAQPEPCEDAVSRKDMLAELDEWREAFDENGHKESCSDMKLVRKFMALLPSAQPEIIYCKDCKHWMPYEWMFSEMWQSKNIADYSEDEIGCKFCDMTMKADDFCSRGERRTGWMT